MSAPGRGLRSRIGFAVRFGAALTVVAILAVACSGAAETPPSAAFTIAPASSLEPGASATAIVPESPIAGVVISVDSQGLDKVHGFKLRAIGGEELTFVIGTLENGDEFPPGHLAEHMAAAAPVLVYFRVENGELVVYRLEDAG